VPPSVSELTSVSLVDRFRRHSVAGGPGDAANHSPVGVAGPYSCMLEHCQVAAVEKPPFRNRNFAPLQVRRIS
jgi:hypothetical protein